MPSLRLTTITNWFDLKTKHPEQELETTDMIRLGRKLRVKDRRRALSADGAHEGRHHRCLSLFLRGLLSAVRVVFDTAVLIPASQNKGLPSQRMERIGDRDFLRRNPGTMSPLRNVASNAPASWRP